MRVINLKEFKILSKILSAIKIELKNYVENASINGVPRFFKSKSTFVKILWFLVLLISSVCMGLFMSGLFQSYYGYPVYTERRELVWNTKQKLKFPDITICNLNIFAEGEPRNHTIFEYFDRVAEQEGDIKYMLKEAINFYRNMTNVNPIPNQDDNYDYPDDEIFNKTINYILNNDIDTLANNSYGLFGSSAGYLINTKMEREETIDCPEIVVDCSFFDMNWFPINAYCSIENFTREWNANYYTCYTIRVSVLTVPDGSTVRGLSLLLNVGPPYLENLNYKFSLTSSRARGVQVSVHSPGTPADLKRGFSVAPGTENIVDITQTKKTRQDYPYTRYVFKIS
ncbi:hypothetical protein HELRODRAFT_168837 [Helobdella robusta]|uniref:Uncharacterized protein n=1 Tax=Helobdella robusta TaxID=6412 RepID=T1F110_HELRO|nr:hypothetical protein HELRODRAFT_168837 [Helobdella robusta]ESO08917.1 hypothetical protein HELRODRAFT_168837 [Helobdella robusta]